MTADITRKFNIDTVEHAATTPDVGPGPWFTVGMGRVGLPAGDEALAAGGDAEVTVGGLSVTRPGLSVDVGNPHTVVVLAQEQDLEAADLTVPPAVGQRNNASKPTIAPLSSAILG